MDFVNNFINIILNIINNFGYIGIFLATYLEYACVPLPSEIVLPFVGILAAKGNVTFIGALLTTLVGGIFGSLTSYLIGYFGGSILLEKLQLKVPSLRKSVEKIHYFLNKFEKASIFFTRLIPLTRTYISLVVGAIKMNLPHFLFYSLGGICVWNTFLISIGYFLGENTTLIKEIMHKYSIIALILIFIVITILVIKKITTKKRKSL